MKAFMIGAFLLVAAIFGTMQVASANPACEGGAMDQMEMTAMLADAGVNHVSLTNDSFDKFAASILETSGVPAPPTVGGIVGPIHEEADGTFLVFKTDGCPYQTEAAKFQVEHYKKALEAAGFGPKA